MRVNRAIRIRACASPKVFFINVNSYYKSRK
jgi:hypothetical protein